MDVTRSNFETMIPEIISGIKTSTFVAIDAEYTGLFADDKSQDVSNSLFDTASERYGKLRKNLEKYMISQLGIAIFRKNPDANELWVEAYNIYLFPISFDSFCKRDNIHLQVSCVNFLAKNNFDFNKFLKEGVPYMNIERAKELKKYLRGTRHFLNTCEIVDKHYFPDKDVDILSNDDIDVIVQRLRGVSKIIDALHESGRPIVGHNVLQDLLLVYQQFWKELPKSYIAFKKNMTHLFPTVFDTKFLAWELHISRKINTTDKILADTNLFKLYSNLSSVHDFNTPLVVPQSTSKKYHKALADGFKENLEKVTDASCHEAAFDAVVTGAVFIKLAYIACRPDLRVWDTRFLPPTTAELFKGVLKYKNNLNLARATIRHVCLEGPDPESNRPDYIRVKSIPGKNGISQSEIRRYLSKYGDVEILVLDSNSLLLACSGIACARNVWKELLKRGYILTKEKYRMTKLGYLCKEYSPICAIAGITIGVFVYFGRKLYK